MKFQPPPINDFMYRIPEKLSTLWTLWFQKLAEFIVGPTVNYLKLDTATTVTSDDVGVFRWNQTDKCGELVVSDVSTLQIGEEEYFPLVVNIGAATIPNGTLVGYGGIDGGIEVVKYIADGSMSSWYVAGIATQDLVQNVPGRISKFGYVRGVNTTGGAESWASGDILYASPTTAGALTKVKPTAPNIAIPTAVVKAVSASDGVLLARVLPQQRLYYGVFSADFQQNATLANTVYAMAYNSSPDIASGFSVQSDGTNYTRIVAANSGLYNFQFSIELNSSVSSTRDVFIWPRVGTVGGSETDVDNSCSQWTIKSNSDTYVPAWNFVLSLAAGQYFRLMWSVNGTGVYLPYVAAITSPYTRPAIPSIILTVTQANQ